MCSILKLHKQALGLVFFFVCGAAGSNAQADQLCNTTAGGGTYGCMNVTWVCGTFTVPEGQVCVSTIVGPNNQAEKEVMDAERVGTVARETSKDAMVRNEGKPKFKAGSELSEKLN